MAELIFNGRKFRGKDLTGQRSQRLVAIKIEKLEKNNGLQKTFWRCKCDCGNETVVFMSNFTNGHTQSCGCWRTQRTSETHTTHGGSKKGQWEKLFGVWRQMMQRCYKRYNNSWNRYGGRGIFVSERWHDYAMFRADMLPTYVNGLTIDRIDNDGPYSPENCHWATVAQQCSNRRSNVFICFNETRKTMKEWSNELGIPYPTLQGRRRLGWSDHKMLSTPFLQRK